MISVHLVCKKNKCTGYTKFSGDMVNMHHVCYPGLGPLKNTRISWLLGCLVALENF